jgi:hypothetical protein
VIPNPDTLSFYDPERALNPFSAERADRPIEAANDGLDQL